MSRSERVPSLDGLRAISIALVLLGHLCGTRGFPSQSQTAMLYSNFGVRVFFVISGFLITTLLIKEREACGKISLTGFYVRRAWRIFPAAFAYLCVITLVNWRTLAGAEILSAFTYTINYRTESAWVLGHLWSLAVEEQFYLLWPVVVALAWKRRRQVAAGVILAGPFVRAAFYFAGAAHANGKYFPCVADALAVGCLLALAEPELKRHVHIIRSRWLLLIPVVSALIPLTHVWLKFYWSAGLTIMHVGIAISVLHCIEKRYWVLNSRPICWLGVLSYSLYLWQEPFINRGSNGWWAAFPQNLGLAFAAAILSYNLVEGPCLRVRDRVRRRLVSPAGVTERATCALTE